MRYKASYGGHELCGIFTYYNHLRDLPPPTYTYYLPIFRRGRLRYLSEHTGASRASHPPFQGRQGPFVGTVSMTGAEDDGGSRRPDDLSASGVSSLTISCSSFFFWSLQPHKSQKPSVFFARIGAICTLQRKIPILPTHILQEVNKYTHRNLE